MADFVFLMHDDGPAEGLDWDPYLTRLREAGVYQGGGVIGEGACVRKAGATPDPTAHILGFIRVNADSFDHARSMLPGNPLFEAGGTVEIRALPRSS